VPPGGSAGRFQTSPLSADHQRPFVPSGLTGLPAARRLVLRLDPKAVTITVEHLVAVEMKVEYRYDLPRHAVGSVCSAHVSVPAGAVPSNNMTLSPVSRPSSLSAAERPGARPNIRAATLQLSIPTGALGAIAPPGVGDSRIEIHTVLTGGITFKIGDKDTDGGLDTSAFLSRGVPLAWKNTGAEPPACSSCTLRPVGFSRRRWGGRPS
jgi:hypothetical protein